MCTFLSTVFYSSAAGCVSLDSCGVQRETFRFTIHDIKPAILRSSLPLFRRHFRFLPLTISQKDQKRGDGYDNKWRNRS